MTRHEKVTQFVSRRSLLKAGGALVVSIGTPVAFDTVLGIGDAFAQGSKPPLTPDQLSSYIAVNADGTVSAFFGKIDMGQGLFVAIGQMVAEELDVPFKAVTVIMGDTATSVNEGGASGSTWRRRSSSSRPMRSPSPTAWCMPKATRASAPPTPS
jgi:nicotinate dehydrogenase subunit B